MPRVLGQFSVLFGIFECIIQFGLMSYVISFVLNPSRQLQISGLGVDFLFLISLIPFIAGLYQIFLGFLISNRRRHREKLKDTERYNLLVFFIMDIMLLIVYLILVQIFYLGPIEASIISLNNL